MGVTAGIDGTVKIGANIVAQIRSWSLNQTGETADTTVLGSADRTHKATVKSWTASISCYWDDTDTVGQGALVVGSSVAPTFLPEGADSGDTKYTGTATVTGVNRTGAVEGNVEVEFECLGNGALTEGTV